MDPRASFAAVITGVGMVAAALPSLALAQGAYQRPPAQQRVPTGSSTTTSTKMSGDEEKAQEIYTKLLAAAQDDVANHQFADGVKAYQQAVKVGESLYGSHDARLVPALSGIVYAQMSWDSYAAMAGGKKGDVGDAVKAQERVVKIYGDDGADAKTHVASMVDLGDVYMYTGNEHAIDTYREAWQLQSKLDSPASADALFAKPAVVRLQLPPNPRGHEEWVATVHYDVGIDGTTSVSEVSGNQPEPLAADIRTSYANGRFRPRFVGGEPVATTGLTSSHKYIATQP